MLSAKALKDAILIAKSITDLKITHPKNFKDKYNPIISSKLEAYESNFGKTPNRLFREVLLEIDKDSMFDVRGFKFLGRVLNNHVWATFKTKNGEYRNMPQLFIAANAESIWYGLGYGDFIVTESPYIERVKSNPEIQEEIARIIKLNNGIKFYNTIKGDLSPSNEIIIDKLIDIKSNWKENSHLMGVVPYDKIGANSWIIIQNGLNDLFDLYKLITIGKGSSEINQERVDTLQQLRALEIKYKDATPQEIEILSKRIERGTISQKIKELYGYKCQVCQALGNPTKTFKTKEGRNYVETHHLIEVSRLVKGSLGVSNLIVVCANHHRQFHYGHISFENSPSSLKLEVDGKKVHIKRKQLFGAKH